MFRRTFAKGVFFLAGAALLGIEAGWKRMTRIKTLGYFTRVSPPRPRGPGLEVARMTSPAVAPRFNIAKDEAAVREPGEDLVS